MDAPREDARPQTRPRGEEDHRPPGRDEPRGGRPLLSVVVPCFNEEAVLPETHRRLTAVLEDVPDLDFELVYVDDGSRDGTLGFLRRLQRADPHVRVLALSRNFGQQIATTAGITESAGDAVVIMDGDLQDPPEVIPRMLERWRRGVDVAYGVRTDRAGEPLFKLWTSKAFYRLIARVADVSIPLGAGDFRLMDRRVADALLAMPERDRFLRGMVAWTGFRQESVPFHRDARVAGETKFPFRKMLRIALDGIVSFSRAPLRLATWLGFFAAGLALLGVVYAFFIRLFTDEWVSGWAAVFIAVVFFAGVQLVIVGILGEYLGRIYGEVKRRPLYFVKERSGFPSVERPAP